MSASVCVDWFSLVPKRQEDSVFTVLALIMAASGLCARHPAGIGALYYLVLISYALDATVPFYRYRYLE